MPLFDRPPIDAVSVSDALFSSGTFRITGGAGVTVGSDASGAVINAAANPSLSYYDNMVQGASNPNVATIATTANQMFVLPLDPGNELFPANMTVSTVMINLSVSSFSTSHVAYSSSVYLGFYTRPNATSLALVNSASTSWNGASSSTSDNASVAQGIRWLTFHNTRFSSSPAFTAGRYYMGYIVRSAGAATSAALFGQNHVGSQLRSGTIGVGTTTGNTAMGHYPLMGMFNTTTTALPAGIAATQINQATPGANFIPAVAFNNLTANF
jgi:hypothetical protein